MKRFRYMLCILGLSGLFSAYQFDAMAATNCNNDVDPGKYCNKRVGIDYVAPCQPGCYCEGNTKVAYGQDRNKLKKTCAQTNLSQRNDTSEMIASKIHFCPPRYPHSDQQAVNPSQCYDTFGTVRVYPNDTVHCVVGRYLPAGATTCADCLSNSICPEEKDYHPDKLNRQGITDCPAGSVANGQHTACLPNIQCSGGWYLKKGLTSCNTACTTGHRCPGNVTYAMNPHNDQGIFACEVGHYQNQAQQSTCKSCDAGYYQDEVGKTSCKACPAGKYQNSTGQGNCKPCRAGTYQNLTGQVNCKPCRAGTYQNLTGQGDCNACPVGTYQNLTGQDSCTPCPNGTYQDQSGQPSCKPCPNGQQPTSDHKRCEDTPTGNNTGATSRTCLDGQVVCPARKYLDSSGNCQYCPVGYRCPGGCLDSAHNGKYPCGPGKYSGSGQAQCTNCINRQYSTGDHNSTYQLCNINNGNSFVGPNHDDCDECPTGTLVSANYESCEAEVYTVTYNCGAHGTGNRPSDTVRYNDPFDPGQGTGCTAVGNYSFDKWTGASDGQTYNGVWLWPHSETLVAQWVEGPAPKYTVKFDCGDGTGNPVPGSVLAANGDSINTPNNSACTWAGHTYTHWISANLTLPAGGSHTWWGSADDVMKPDWGQDDQTGCIVKYDCGDGTLAAGVQNTFNVSYGNTFNIAQESVCIAPTNKPEFKGWNVGNSPVGGTQYTCNGTDIIFIAQWGPAPQTSCSVTYVCGNNADDPISPTLPYGWFNVSPNICEHGMSNKVFGGWMVPGQQNPLQPDDSYFCDGSDLTMTAKWNSLDTHTITYNNMENATWGTGESHPNTYTAGTATAIGVPSRTNYVFSGWCVNNANCSNYSNNVGGYTIPASANTDYNMYAKWTESSPDTHTITYNNMEDATWGTGESHPNTYTAGTATAIGVPNRTNCTFSGWCVNNANCSNYSNNVGGYTIPASANTDYNMYAKWTGCSNNVDTTVTTCPSGQYVPVGGTSCTNCPSGSFCPTAGTAVAGKSYSCFMGTPNSSRTTCRMVLDKDNLLYGLGNGDNCWLKPLVAGPDGYKHCMFEGIRQVQ